ncbi:Peptidoglycan-binding lysin domain [Macleaya cordata]|uniref:Peptidoglycan-binding lysin domain n=1 Tax=Macleaya cordata TaxID=56857 RepID=A0A200PZ10_MACCD|nr:Peptidoglycan-binding lysin domain [Macleaya cordata]
MQADVDTILNYNPQVPNKDSIKAGNRLNVPFSCDCINGEFLGHFFDYPVISGDTYERVATRYYSNLTTLELLRRFNSYNPLRIPDVNARLNVTVTCSCGDENVSKDYGLFITYPLRLGQSLESVAFEFNLSSDLLRRYNPNSNFSSGSGLVYIPGKGDVFFQIYSC